MKPSYIYNVHSIPQKASSYQHGHQHLVQTGVVDFNGARVYS